nr:hypothetical protein GCM10010200_013230 [Actinomadura rugatobispora]
MENGPSGRGNATTPLAVSRKPPSADAASGGQVAVASQKLRAVPSRTRGTAVPSPPGAVGDGG